MPPAWKPLPAKMAAPVKRAAKPAVATTAIKKVPLGPMKRAATPVPATKKLQPEKAKAPAPPKAIVPAKAAPPPTVSLRQIAAGLADRHDLTKKQAEEMLTDLVEVTIRHLESGDKVRLTGLGILQVRALPARMGRNPATGEAVEIKASRKVAFRPAKELKALV